MSNPILDIYYDNPNEASDMYLKYLIKDCEKNFIDVRIFDDADKWMSTDGCDAELFLEPTLHIDNWLKDSDANVDNPSATAQGIFNYITTNFKHRSNTIAVIGRGLVGKQLIDMLINYGYTVYEFNGKSNKDDMLNCIRDYADVVVGLADKTIFDADTSFELYVEGITLIDSGYNFQVDDKSYKLMCGKWTRQVIIDRVLENYKKGLKDGGM